MGKSLLQRCYENSCRSQLITELVIATEDDRIVEHAHSFGASAALTSADCLTGSDRAAELLAPNLKWMQADAIVNIQGDEPCLSPSAIDAAIQLLLQDADAVVSTLAVPLKDRLEANNPSIVKCITDQFQNGLYFSRALIPSSKQGIFHPSFPYLRHVGLYVFRPHFLLTYGKLPPTPLQLEEDLEQLKILEHGYRIKVARCGELPPGVDTPEDIHQLEQWICKQNTFLSQGESALL